MSCVCIVDSWRRCERHPRDTGQRIARGAGTSTYREDDHELPKGRSGTGEPRLLRSAVARTAHARRCGIRDRQCHGVVRLRHLQLRPYPYLGRAVPHGSTAQATLFALATFAISFLVRPPGGLFWGPLGDRLGRKHVLALTIVIMLLAMLAVGLLPSYASIGMWAPLTLVVLRMIQGFRPAANTAARRPSWPSTRRITSAASAVASSSSARWRVFRSSRC